MNDDLITNHALHKQLEALNKHSKSKGMNWIKFSDQLPPEGEIVMTKIDDKDGIRNEQRLIRKGNLMWFTDMSMYVYYAPTHWKHL